jgi:hypothetical protein
MEQETTSMIGCNVIAIAAMRNAGVSEPYADPVIFALHLFVWHLNSQ